MLSEGIRAGCEYLGLEHRTVCHVEREIAAAAQLVTLMEAGIIDHAPIWDDLISFDGKPWRGIVDCITAGFPCQPWSQAGKREGTADDRWIWPDIARIIREIEPALCVFENVPGLISGGGLEFVLADLAELGFDAEWCVVAASDVGASHERKRVFILAYARCVNTSWAQHISRSGWTAPDNFNGSIAVANTESERGRIRQRNELARRNEIEGAGVELGDAGLQHSELFKRSVRAELARTECAMADTSGTRLQVGSGGGSNDESFQQAIRPDTPGFCSLFAPGPSDPRWAGILGEFPWLAPALESGVRVLADEFALVVDESRTDQLRAIGNGCVPLAVSAAFVVLARRAGIFE